MASTAERIKERLSIVDVISSYIKVEHAGANFKARCPFHNEKTPSFFISPARNNYYCFGCGQKGDIFSFVQEYEKLDFMGALKVLAERAGIPLEEFKSDAYKKSERQYKILEAAMEFYERLLWDADAYGGAGKSALTYLLDRGLTEESAKEWRIGFAPDEWRSVSDHLIRHRVDGQTVTLNEMEAVGLIKQNDGKCYDRFRSRIMFPLFDSSGRVVGFSGRIFGKEEGTGEGGGGPKYLNSPDSQTFNKSEVLYGFDRAKHAIREWGYAILVEGQMDLLMSHQVGVKNAVATSGTALTALHLEKIGRMTKNLIFMYDADNAGYGATRRGERLAIEQGFDVKVVTLPKGEDPASLIKKDKQAFVAALKKSTHVVEYYLGVLMEKYPNEHDFIKAIEKEIVPDIALTPSSIRRGELISLIATRGLKSKIDEKRVSDEVDAMVRKIAAEGRESVLGMGDHDGSGDEKVMGGKSHGANRPNEKRTSVDVSLRRTLALMAYVDSLAEQSPEPRRSVLAKIRDEAEASIARFILGDDAKAVEELRTSDREALLFEGEAFFGQLEDEANNHGEHLGKHLSELLHELEERSLKQKLNEYMSQLSLAESAKDKVKSDEIIKKCQEISLRLAELHKKKRT